MPVMPSRKPAIIRNVRLRVLLCQRILYSAATEPFQRIFEHRAGEDPVRGAGKHLNHLPSRCVARRGSAGSCGRRRLGRQADRPRSAMVCPTSDRAGLAQRRFHHLRTVLSALQT